MKRNYVKHSFYLSLLVLVTLGAISFIPPFKLLGIEFKRANIFSDLYQFNDQIDSLAGVKMTDADLAFLAELDDSTSMVGGDSVDLSGATMEWVVGKMGDYGGVMDSLSGAAVTKNRVVDEAEFERVIKFEEYSDGDNLSVSDFASLLGTETEHRVVRIGFLGDSFIEGDIIVADIREQLQTQYGGGGVGFIPFSTQLAQNRPTIKHSSSGWEEYSLIDKNRTPAHFKDEYSISGIISSPRDGRAEARYEMTNFRSRLNSVTSAKILFKSDDDATVELCVNDTVSNTLRAEGSPLVQLISVEGEHITSLEVKMSQSAAVVGYGVVLEGSKGVGIDLYSIRGNSGLAILGTNNSVNRQIDRLLGYDMIVLQYGLNVMQADVVNYRVYGEGLKKLIEYVKVTLPHSTIVVMGIGDRSALHNGELISMPGVAGMLSEQRAVAKECGVAFWSIYDAMGGYNSMKRYVDRGWAAQDYTHLSFSGGKAVAKEFVRALEYARVHPLEKHTKQTDRTEVQVPQGEYTTIRIVPKESEQQEQPKDSVVVIDISDGVDSLIMEELDELKVLEKGLKTEREIAPKRGEKGGEDEK